MAILDRFKVINFLSKEEDDLNNPIKLLNEDDFFVTIVFLSFAASGTISVSIFWFLFECGTACHPIIGMIATEFPEWGSERLVHSSCC